MRAVVPWACRLPFCRGPSGGRRRGGPSGGRQDAALGLAQRLGTAVEGDPHVLLAAGRVVGEEGGARDEQDTGPVQEAADERGAVLAAAGERADVREEEATAFHGRE